MKTEAPPGRHECWRVSRKDERTTQNPPRDWQRDADSELSPVRYEDSVWWAERFDFSVDLSIYDVCCCLGWRDRLQLLDGEIKVVHAELGFVKKNTPIAWLKKPQDPSYRKTLLITPVDSEVIEKSQRLCVQSWTLKPTESVSVSRWMDAYENGYTASCKLSKKLLNAARGPLYTWQPELGRLL